MYIVLAFENLPQNVDALQSIVPLTILNWVFLCKVRGKLSTLINCYDGSILSFFHFFMVDVTSLSLELNASFIKSSMTTT